MKKECKVVMLPSKTSKVIINKMLETAHLYIVSNEEINPSDWFINTLQYEEGYYRVHLYEESTFYRPDIHKKVIASTDNALALPRPSNEFIDAYCKAGGFDEVLVEYDEVCYKGPGGCLCSSNRCEKLSTELKVAPDNTITIHKVQAKDSYTKEEVIELMDKLVEHIRYPFEHPRRYQMLILKQNWIKQNLS